jgi:hypothetical protein
MAKYSEWQVKNTAKMEKIIASTLKIYYPFVCKDKGGRKKGC